MILERTDYAKLLDWKNSWGASRALLLEGQRRVGKSTLVEEFAKREYEDYLLIDFSDEHFQNDGVFSLASKNQRRMNEFFNQLFVLADRERALPQGSPIIFDEVQLYPKARQAIKHLVADGRYSYIETGSLVSIKSKSKNILVPSEETSISLFPLTFAEFLQNTGSSLLLSLIKEAYEMRQPLSEAIHREAMKKLRAYLIVGGMPQAVVSYANNEDYARIDLIKRDILHLYREDIQKEKKESTKEKILALFDAVPSQLSTHQSRFFLKKVNPKYRKDNTIGPLTYLDDSMVLNRCFNTNEPQLAMPLSRILGEFRIYPSDVGLYITQLFLGSSFSGNPLYKKLLLGELSINEGTLMEAYVAQQLKAMGKPLYYHTFQTKGSTSSYEIDFLIPRGEKVIPIEVKSNNRFGHRSIDVFKQKYGKASGTPIVLSPKPLKEEDDILYLPLYMAPFLS